MKVRFLITLITLVATAAAFADKPVSRTVVIRDGKVVSGNLLDLSDFAGKRAFLGVSLMSLTPQLREHFGAAKDTGVLVESVEENSPAAKAGLRVGDVITAVDGKDVESGWELRRTLKDKKEGDAVRVEYLRNGARNTAVATLVEREMPRVLFGDLGELGELGTRIGEQFRSPEWRARIESMQQDCGDVQSKLQELDRKLKELEKKLQK
jgi:serine protease Do